MRILVILILLVGFSSPVLSSEGGPKFLQELQTEEFLLEGSLWERIEREARRKTIQCMRAFPHEEFCTCLGSELPMPVNMTQYALAVTLSREEVGYEQLSEEQRSAFDKTIQAREVCAAQMKQ